MTEIVQGPEALYARALSLESAAGRAATADEAVAAWLELAALRRDALEDIDGAIAALRRAIQIQPGHRGALNRYAQACAMAERWSELVDVLELSARAARSKDERARVLAHRGDVLGKKLGRIAEARSMYRDVVRLSEDEGLAQAAREAVEKIDALLGQQRSAPRERTFVGRPRGPSMTGETAPPPAGSDRPSITEEKVDHHNRAARLALEEGRRIDARAWVEQALAMRPWNTTALAIRHDILRSEGRWNDLVKLLVVESEEAPHPEIAAAALREAADVTADALGDFDGALALHRKALDYPRQEEAGIGAAMRLALRHRRLDAAQKIWPELTPEARAERLEQLAAAVSAAGDAEVALALRAAAFDDRPADVGFFQARLQVLAKLGDVAATETVLVQRMALVSDPDERRALTWELSASFESRGRWRDALEPLLELVAQVETDEEVREVLVAVDRLAAQAHDRTQVVRALETASSRARGNVAGWLVALARVLRDELLDVEGAEAAFLRAAELGADVEEELEQIRARLSATGADSIPRHPTPLDDDTIDSDDAAPPLVMVVEEPQVMERTEPRALVLPPSDPAELVLPASLTTIDGNDTIDATDTDTDEGPRVVLAEPQAVAVGEGGAVPQDVTEATTDGARRLLGNEEVTDARSKVSLPGPFDALAEAVIEGRELHAARWLAEGRKAVLRDDHDDARACFARGIEAARGLERVAAALVDAAWAPDPASASREDVPEATPAGRAALRVLEIGELAGRALAVRAAQIAAMWSEEGDPIAEAWLEAAARADPQATEAVSTLYQRAIDRGDRAEARGWLALGLGAVDAGAKWWLRAADLEAADGHLDRSAAALERALEAAPLDLEPARRLAELGAEALEVTWLSEGLAEMRDRYLWSRSIRRAAVVALVRMALGLDDAADALLVETVRLERDGAPDIDAGLPEERRHLERVLAACDVEGAREILDPGTDAGRRRLLLVLSPPFLLADLP